MGDGCHGEKATLLRPVKICHLHQNHCDLYPVRVQNALGLSGGTAGVHEHAFVITAAEGAQLLWRLLRHGGQQVDVGTEGPQAHYLEWPVCLFAQGLGAVTKACWVNRQ